MLKYKVSVQGRRRESITVGRERNMKEEAALICRSWGIKWVKKGMEKGTRLVETGKWKEGE